MSVVHVSDNPHADASIYSVSNSKILYIGIKLESIQEEQDTPLVESEIQQHIFRWVRKNIKHPSVQGQICTVAPIVLQVISTDDPMVFLWEKRTRQ